MENSSQEEKSSMKICYFHFSCIHQIPSNTKALFYQFKSKHYDNFISYLSRNAVGFFKLDHYNLVREKANFLSLHFFILHETLFSALKQSFLM